MARYIDAKQLINRFMLKNKDKLRLSTIVNEIEIAEKGLSREVEAVEVVRCKNCKYSKDMCMSGMYCDHPDNIMPLGCNENDFCSYGERKDK